MIYEIRSEWSELDGKWIRAESKDEAREYLINLNCEYSFALEEVQGVPMDKPDFDVKTTW